MRLATLGFHRFLPRKQRRVIAAIVDNRRPAHDWQMPHLIES
jgi:hypothetical protein